MKHFLDALRNFRYREITTAILLTLVGVVMIIFPDDAVRIVAIVYGAMLALYAVLDTTATLTDSAVNSAYHVITLVYDLFLLIFGFLLIFRSADAIAFVALISGIFLIVDGAKEMFRLSVYEGNKRTPPYVAAVVFAVFTAAFGAVLIAIRSQAQHLLGILVGIALVYLGVSHFVLAYRVGRVEKRAKKNDYIEGKFVDHSDE